MNLLPTINSAVPAALRMMLSPINLHNPDMNSPYSRSSLGTNSLFSSNTVNPLSRSTVNPLSRSTVNLLSRNTVSLLSRSMVNPSMVNLRNPNTVSTHRISWQARC